MFVGQVATAAGMGIIGEKLNAQAVLALGDNFYTYGKLLCRSLLGSSTLTIIRTIATQVSKETRPAIVLLILGTQFTPQIPSPAFLGW